MRLHFHARGVSSATSISSLSAYGSVTCSTASGGVVQATSLPVLHGASVADDAASDGTVADGMSSGSDYTVVMVASQQLRVALLLPWHLGSVLCDALAGLLEQSGVSSMRPNTTTGQALGHSGTIVCMQCC